VAGAGKGDHTLVVTPGERKPQPVDAGGHARTPRRPRCQPAVDPKYKTEASASTSTAAGRAGAGDLPGPEIPGAAARHAANGTKVGPGRAPGRAGGADERICSTRRLRRGPRRKLGTASFAMGMLDEGAGDYDALALGDRTESLGANLSAGRQPRRRSAGLSALKQNLEPSLALFADVLRVRASTRTRSSA
jgi:zinc protease